MSRDPLRLADYLGYILNLTILIDAHVSKLPMN